MTHWMRQYGGSVLLIILAFAYVTRMYQLHIPEKYMFDEVYHGVTAKLISRNDPRAFEWWNPAPEPNTAVDWLHPPLAKYFQALSINAFGENSFGWRFSSVVFGVLLIVVIYHLTLQLFKKESIALAAAALASLDGLLLVLSRIAMNDIFVTFFIILTLLIFSRFREKPTPKLLLLTGLCAGLAIASKWSGVFVLMIVWFFQGLTVLEMWSKNKWSVTIKNDQLTKILQTILVYTVTLLIIPAAVYVLSYSQMFLQGKNFEHFRELHNQIWYYQTHLKETHPYQSRPWQWALNVRPVWYYVEYLGTSRADVYAFGNPPLFYAGLLSILYSIVRGITFVYKKVIKRSKQKTATMVQSLLTNANTSPLFFLVLSYCMVWMPWQFSPRIMFFYHYAPAVPLLCIVLAYWLVHLYKNKGSEKILSITVWSLIILAFIVWYPHWVGISVPTTFANKIYFAFETWR